MNFKTISTIIALLSLDLLVLSSPVNNKNNSFDITDISIDGVDNSQNIPEEGFLIEDVEITENVDINIDEIDVDIDTDSDEEITENVNNENVCNTTECIEVSNNILNSIDISVDPCEDFYQFSCGNWIKNHPVDKNNIQIDNFSSLSINIDESLRKIIEGDYIPSKNLSKKAQEFDEKLFNKLKGFYNKCMDVDSIDKEGVKPILNIFNKLKIRENKDKFNDANELSKALARIHNMKENGSRLLFELSVALDDNKQLILSIGQGLPHNLDKSIMKSTLSLIFEDSNDRDFDKMADLISKFDEKLFDINENDNEENDNENENAKENENVRENENTNENEDKDEIDTKIEEILNQTANTKSSKNLLNKLLENIETNETEDNTNKVEKNQEDEEEGITYISIKSLNEQFPNINWKLYLEERYESVGMKELITDDTLILIYSKKYLEKLNKILEEVDSETLSYYLEWFIIGNFIDYLPSTLKYVYYEKEDTKPRSHICFNIVNNIMDDVIGRYYVENNYSPTKKQYSDKVIEYIKQSMINRIPEVEWLDDDTIEYAYKKVSSMTEIIGYEDYIMDPEILYDKYENMGISENDYFNNMINYNIYSNKEVLKYLNSTLSDIYIGVSPQTVNAQYLLNKNLMNIPAGILQPPFFSSGIPDYINYGGIGSIIGHEFTHAFDNTGKNWDMNGNIYNWWTQNDLEEYEDLTKCFIDQYSKFYKVDSEGKKHYVNGELTLDENIADNGGLSRAYESWKLSLKEDPETVKKENQQLPGLTQYTPDQLFFISYGQIWCENYNDPYLVNIMLKDEHSPGNARLNGVVSNLKHFAKAFNCPLKSNMNPEKKCIIW